MNFTSHDATATGISMPVVIIVDDDPSMRVSIDSLMRSIDLHTKLYASAAEFLAATLTAGPSCVIMDIKMPGMGGLELQSQMQKKGKLMPVVFITGYGDIPTTVRAMKAGATDFLIKPFRDQEIIDAVSAALLRDQARLATEKQTAAIRSRHDTLTRREREVMALVTEGKLNKQVAASLGLSEITVKLHRASVMRKMAARTLVDLVQFSDALGGAREQSDDK